MLERKSRRLRPKGTAQLARVYEPPHGGAPERVIQLETIDSMAGTAHAAQAMATTGRRLWRAGTIALQRYTARSSEINEANEINMAARHVNASRALGRSRRGRVL